ncbi:hypothetical protein ACROYT_G005527 [Oculina patagonica]
MYGEPEETNETGIIETLRHYKCPNECAKCLEPLKFEDARVRTYNECLAECKRTGHGDPCKQGCDLLYRVVNSGDGPNGIWYDTRNVDTKGPYLFCRTSHELLINFEIQLVSKNSEVEPVYFIIFYRFSETDQWDILGLVQYYRNVQEIWISENMPEDWKTGLIVRLAKKGDLSDCNNWRGVTLTSKVFSKIILRRMTAALEKDIRKEQAGFRKGRSYSDHIFTLRQIFEQAKEWNSTVYANFIDFEKAFDSIHRETLWCILRHYGIPSTVVNIIRMLYHDCHAQVICENQNTTQDQRGIRWTLSDVLSDLDFADDICLLVHRHTDMQAMTEGLASTAAVLGLKVSPKKTKHMRMNHPSDAPITLHGKIVEEVNEFTYLGSKMTTDGDSEPEIKARLSKAGQAFASLKNIWKSKKITLKTKLRFFKSNVLTTLLYGCESWKATKAICHKLDTFQNRCLRRILNIFWPNIISNAELRRATSTNNISSEVKKRRWRWIGHVLRMDPSSIPRVALHWTPTGKRARGRPKETWRRTVEKEMRESGLSWGELTKNAKNRQQWRNLVTAFCVQGHEED